MIFLSQPKWKTTTKLIRKEKQYDICYDDDVFQL